MLDPIPASPQRPKTDLHARTRGRARASAVRLSLLVVGCVVYGVEAQAQSETVPSSHWGSQLSPSLIAEKKMGMSVFLFTEFGKKDKITNLPQRYNHIDRTLGINYFTLSNNRPLTKFSSYSGDTWYQSSIGLGVVTDRPTEFLQNEVIHETWNIEKITRQDQGYGPIVSYSGQLNHQIKSFRLLYNGESKLQKSPLFIGSGFSFSTLYQDLFVQTGLINLPIRHAKITRAIDPYVYIQLSVLARAGLALPGLPLETEYFSEGAYFSSEELFEQYLTTQFTISFHILEKYIPLILQTSITRSTGVFAKSDVNNQANDEWPIPGQYISFGVHIGNFYFETFNDIFGNEDIGPSFGAKMYYQIPQDFSPLDWAWRLADHL